MPCKHGRTSCTCTACDAEVIDGSRPMPDITDDLAAITAALDAGPTPGPWRYLEGTHSFYAEGGKAVALVYGRRRAEPDAVRDANVALIAACSPDRIRRVVEECERLRADAAIGAVVWHFIDRMSDVCEQDPADKIVAEFVAAVQPAIDAALKPMTDAVEAARLAGIAERAAMQEPPK